MARHFGRVVEIESLAEFDEMARAGASMRGWRVQDVDLTTRTDLLLRMDPRGALLLGASLTEPAEQHLRGGGALVFPAIPDVPFDPYRARLYAPDELYAGVASSTYVQTPDARIYAWYRRSGHDLARTLAEALHDHAIDDALEEAVDRQPAIGVMGSHALSRDAPSYPAAARLGRSLARSGRLVITGGGPGAMEAVNLGALLATYDDSALDEALALLTGVPGYEPDVGAWARLALEVRRRWPDGGTSIGIPTWFYGHEPPNAFASLIAKYFHNALREDILLRLCSSGIVFLPGAAGTVQEIFQDACENYYATEAAVAPMVLVGVQHWTRELPAWPLLELLARDRVMASHLHLVDTVDEALDLLGAGGSG
ncbi:MAG: LOG family protein [Nocardioidaceae bacterium]